MAASSPTADRALADLAKRFEAELWALAAGDQIALRVLNVMSNGITSNPKIAHAIGLPVTLVENARKRIQRLATKVPAPLLADVRDELDIEPPRDDPEPAWPFHRWGSKSD